VSDPSETLIERIRVWVRDHSGTIRESLFVLAQQHCGLEARDASTVSWATIEAFIARAGRTPDPDRDFAMLLGTFRQTIFSRFPASIPRLGALRTLPNRPDVLEALREFPGGLMASLPEVDLSDWRNAVLAVLPGRSGPEPRTPWVHPPGGFGGPPAEEGDPSSPVPALVSLLFDPDPEVRLDAARALALLGPEASEAADALRVVLEDPDRDVREAARAALEMMGEQA
jgi:hypothetical protein